MGRTTALSEIELRPSGTGEGTVAGVECDRVCCVLCCWVKNVRSVGDVFFGMLFLFEKTGGLWRRVASVVVDVLVSCLQLD